MPAPRIAVSGVGLVTALGESAPQTFGALMAGQRGIAPLTLFDPGDVRSLQVAEVKGLRVRDIAPNAREAEFSRTDAMAVAAAIEAVKAARLPAAARVGVVLGGTTGGMFETEDLLSSPQLETLAGRRAQELVSYPLSASLSRVAEAIGGARVRRSICSACSGGAVALVQAAAWLAADEVDFVVAGGADALCRLTVLGFNALGATDPEPCRPFDRARAGLNLGEGAGILVLEREVTARERGAEVLAWLDGYAVGAEAHHITHPDPTGKRALELLRGALARAGLEAAALGYVNAHGTGTRQNDAMEASALLSLLGPNAPTWVSTSKAQLGHTLGAAGAIEAVLTVLALARGEVPPTAGLLEPELAGLRHVTERGRPLRFDAALSTSFGFGGMSCVLAFVGRNRAALAAQPGKRRVAVLAAAALGADAASEAALDPDRSRRFDDGSALAATSAANLAMQPMGDTGLVVGTAFGNVARTMAFLTRGRKLGPRHISPAEFPHLVPSAAAGNASIYARLTGPVFAVSDLEHSGEAAFAAACELIVHGVASRMVAGAVAPRDAIVERVLSPLLEPTEFNAAARGGGAGFVLLSELTTKQGQGRRVTEVLGHYVGDIGEQDALDAVPRREPGVRAAVVLGVAGPRLRRALEGCSWAGAARLDLAAERGYHEALGAVALAVASQRIVAGEYEKVLVLSGSASAFRATLLGLAADVED